jgi:hypothetical protein
MTKPAMCRRREETLTMAAAMKCHPAAPRTATSAVERDIRDFLIGKTHGESLLHALYDHVLDEPVPERLRAALRG